MAWIRKERPEFGNVFYNTENHGGISQCILGNHSDIYYTHWGLDVLRNCVGAAAGAFNETYCHNTYGTNDDGSPKEKHFYFALNANADELINLTKRGVYDTDTVKLSDYVLPKTARPPLGGLIVWADTHVAYICGVSEDGNTIVLQESGWHSSNDVVPSFDSDNNELNYPTDTGYESPWGWRSNITRERGDDNNFGYGKNGCLGFIANPAISKPSLPDATWHTKKFGGFGRVEDGTFDNRETSEGFQNVIMIYKILSSKGWSLKSVCAFLGNIDMESEYNPWQWESVYSAAAVPTYDEAYGWSEDERNSRHGYGLVQFTPFTDYVENTYKGIVASSYEGYGPNFKNDGENLNSINDGTAQLLFMHDTIIFDGVGGQWYNIPSSCIGEDGTNYWLPYKEFINGGEYSVGHLTSVFLRCYLRPNLKSSKEFERRRPAAETWYSILRKYDLTPGTPIPPEPQTSEPCAYIQINGVMVKTIPHIMTSSGWKKVIPTIRNNNSWKEIYDNKTVIT